MADVPPDGRMMLKETLNTNEGKSNLNSITQYLSKKVFM
jgi:hypothetical protein